MKKLAILTILACAAAGAFAQTAAAKDSTPSAGPGLIDWLYVKAVAVSCKHDIPEMERTLERTLPGDRRSKMHALLDEAIKTLNLTPQDCIKATSWATRAVKAIDAGENPPALFN